MKCDDTAVMLRSCRERVFSRFDAALVDVLYAMALLS